jgi:LPS O-antigen subunit length determinant protein (WzzB/FepE family)
MQLLIKMAFRVLIPLVAGFFSQLEYQRQELLRERQQFHMEQLRAAEYRAKQLAAQQLTVEQQQRAAAMQQATTHSSVPPTESHG